MTMTTDSPSMSPTPMIAAGAVRRSKSRQAIVTALLAISIATPIGASRWRDARPPARPAPVVTAHELGELAAVVAEMPEGWAATQAMRRQIVDECADGQPLHELAAVAAKMPATWSATKAMIAQVRHACGDDLSTS